MMNGSVHESIKALDGYCALYHLLCTFVVKYPELQDAIDERIRSFNENERMRSKRPCPNLVSAHTCTRPSSLCAD
jgi:hypothetical protein